MSFQGDVRGIGLAELLQGLSRGRKEGVLTLTARGGHRLVLGMEEGRAWLLPDPDEDPETWRVRARNAWPEDPDASSDAMRLRRIVRAARLEILFAHLDGGGVHFRFDPGSLPDRETRLKEEGHPETEIHPDAAQVEYLLLEYARIADELELAGEPTLVDPEVIPCLQHTGALPALPPGMAQEIDGNSTLIEIADRLGWPVRQAQVAAMAALTNGSLRPAHPIEVLRLARYELAHARFARAASRLAFWCRQGVPGPLDPEDAAALTENWCAGGLTSALRWMSMADVRCLMRRLDASFQSTARSIVHWTEALRIDPNDRISRLRLAAMRLRNEGASGALDAREVLDLARELREQGTAARSGPAFAIAAHLQPESLAQRLELGLGLVQADRINEGAPWVLSACTELLAEGRVEHVLGPLRILSEQAPRDREVRELYARAKRQSRSSKHVRRSVAVAASVLAMLGTAAVVQVKLDEKRDQEIAVIRQLLANPSGALAELDARFPGDDSTEIGDLRRELEGRLRAHEIGLRASWLDSFHEAQREAQDGDVEKALTLVAGLPRPPRLQIISASWPDANDVLMIIPNRLRADVESLGPASNQVPQQVVVETRVLEQSQAVRRKLSGEEFASIETRDLVSAVDRIDELLTARAHERSLARREDQRQRRQAENDRILVLAQAAVERKNYERALRHYELILENDPKGQLREALREEIAEARAKRDALHHARQAAIAGRHDKAFEILAETFEDSVRVMLPFEVRSIPTGVDVRVTHQASGESTESKTPFTIEGTFQDQWVLQFSLEDFDRRVLAIQGPQDIDLTLSRTPSLSCRADGRVDALPTPIGPRANGDYVVCDRNGNVRRIGWGGEERWSRSVKTLSGFARRPLPLPSLTKRMLLLTETGAAWIVDTEDGQVEGPWDLGEPPALGPVIVGDEIHAQLRGGGLARWSTTLQPTLDDSGGTAHLGPSLRRGDPGPFTALRPAGTGDPVLDESPGDSGWSVRVGETHYEVSSSSRAEQSYLIARSGEWSYLAWEAPVVADEEPALWISDGAGLRAYLPPGSSRTVNRRDAPERSDGK